MSETILSTIITCAVTLVGVFVSAWTTQNKVTHELDKQNALQNQEIQHIKEDIKSMKEDIRTHNHYAQMFQETASLLQEKQSVANHRISDLENRLQ